MWETIKVIGEIIVGLSALFLSPLILTIVIESAAAFLMGLRTRRELWAVVLINLVTNPVGNYFINHKGPYSYVAATDLLYAEAIIVVVEMLLLMFALRLRPVRAFLYSLVLNAASLGIGLLIIAHSFRFGTFFW